MAIANSVESRPTVPATDESAANGEQETLAQGDQRDSRPPLSTRSRVSLLDYLDGYESLLRKATRYFREATERGSLSYAAEWILDNYYVAQQTVRQIREDMPRGYYRQLPVSAAGALAGRACPALSGIPRIYVLAQDLLVKQDTQLDVDALQQFVATHEEMASATMGELWALPVMLRFAVLECLAQAISRITGIKRDKSLPTLALGARPADDEIVANCITSLRTLSTQDWHVFFESVSQVERILRSDPAGIYPRMEKESRNRYRKVVEDLAKTSGQAETEVARQAVALARAALEAQPALHPLPAAAARQQTAEMASASAASPDTSGGDGYAPDTLDGWEGLAAPRAVHAGYFLVDAGRAALEERLAYHPHLAGRFVRWVLAHATIAYLGSIGLLYLLVMLPLLFYLTVAGAGLSQLALAAVLTLAPALTVAASLVDWITTLIVKPEALPKLNFEDGIPERCQSLIAIPALLTRPADVASLLAQLEQHFLRNRDDHLVFALLTDFSDAAQEKMPEDDALLERARAGIEILNQKYMLATGRPFYLLHRRRLWNPKEGVWMGWERKRGKLHELNQLLRDSGPSSFSDLVGDLDRLRRVRYVITLDADTQLEQGGAQALVATLAHPLNRAEFDPLTGAVAAGYTLLQPRAEITPTSANVSLFTHIFSGDTGLDLYTRAVSNVYQDLFGEGIYIGKGIYDVDAFERSLSGRVPENTLLSHDLFEGIHGRAGLVTDIVILEDYPPNFLVHMQRMRRWMRGDWQILPWLLPRVPDGRGGTRPNSLSVIDRWKILDNLRRSLLAPSLLALLVAGWLFLPGSPLAWTIVGALAPAMPVMTGLLAELLRGARRGARRGITRHLFYAGARWLLALVFLPYEALTAADAIVTTLWRLFVTRRGLLRWTTAAETVRIFGLSGSSTATQRRFLAARALAAVLVIAAAVHSLDALCAASPLLIAWMLSPEIAHLIGRPLRHEPPPLSQEQRYVLRTLARRTWLFFEQFVGPEDNWLPPDYFQEDPREVVAHRTSPTNMGMLLMSILAAYDLGYVGLRDLVPRLRATFDGMAGLERYRGHFLNWYDTRSLEPLSPRYVSTVDSGNLAACLLTLGQACQDLRQAPIQRWQMWEGVLDTFSLLADVARDIQGLRLGPAVLPLLDWLASVWQDVLAARENPQTWWSLLNRLGGQGLQEMEHLILSLVEAHSRTTDATTLRDLRTATVRVRQCLESAQRNLEAHLPWLSAFQAPPQLLSANAPEGVRRLWQKLQSTLPPVVALNQLPDVCRQGEELLASIQAELAQADSAEAQQAASWCAALQEKVHTAAATAQDLLDGLADIDRRAEDYFQAMDFSFLFDRQRQVFRIGYNLAAASLDANHYDLLASESRIASIVAISKDDVPPSHWLHLARPLTQLDGTQALLSWSATMFEYLMPDLLMRSPQGTLLHQTNIAVVEQQMAYGSRKRVPWGISESGYFAFDANLGHQYGAFGVPGLGFKRILADELVVTPYASVLALNLRPANVLENLVRLRGLGMVGSYGLYEALDYTPTRRPPGEKYGIVRSYMAHHQGMILLSLVNYLQDDIMIRRFHSDPRIRSVQWLLQERIPVDVPMEVLQPDGERGMQRVQAPASINPWSVPVHGPAPHVHYLSNGRYGVLITGAGGGYSRWQDVGLTRWRADTTLDNWGSWIYIQDRESGALWSATFQPTASQPASQNVQFYAHMAEFRRTDGDISVTMELTVAPDDDVEIRRLTFTNESDQGRRLRVASYAEVILARQATDARHPAFNKLFIESEYVGELNTLLFRRRPRSESEQPLYMAHTLVLPQGEQPTGAHESDRARFMGRGADERRPLALRDPGHELSRTTGATLDPIMSLGQDIELEPHGKAQVTYLTMAAGSRSKILELATRYQPWSMQERAFAMARSRADLELRQLELTTPDLQHIQELLSLLLYPHAALRPQPQTLAANVKGQSGLWAFGISGDYPILLFRLSGLQDLPLLELLLRAHTYWRNRRLTIDLVIMLEQASSYDDDVRHQIQRLRVRLNSEDWLNRRGGLFIVYADQMGEADRVLLETAARVVIDPQKGSLEHQVEVLAQERGPLPPLTPVLAPNQEAEPDPQVPRPIDLLFDNGLGGFSPDGHEYVIYLEPGKSTPAPWINVVANAEFGFLVSEAGAGYSWSLNSGENRLTPWSNDPLLDPPGEAVYVRDEETGEVWSPAPAPGRGSAPYMVRHGGGYSVVEQWSHGLKQRLRYFVAPDAPVKIVQLRLENTWQHTRRITATFYAEWVLGVLRDASQQYVVPEFDAETQALLARNAYNAEFGERIAFAAASKRLHGLTADRAEFLGRMGSLAHPMALNRVGLSGTVEAGRDPCAALQVHIELQPGAAEEVYFLLGEGEDRQQTLQLIRRFQDPQQVEAAWSAATSAWDDLLGHVQVSTPEPGMNLLLNRWLLYETLACRLWGRSALYQPSGAYGFRDQLQDVLALVHAAPALAREHILRAARQQFEQGDVLHWWHPPAGRGVRTRISDDLLWLPFVTARYVAATGDQSILNETLPFLTAPLLESGEDERYGVYASSKDSFSLYEHCKRAIARGATAGPHGLPLMGSGDWNDGMNRVGIQGRGESVWLGWFLFATLTQFADLSRQRGDATTADGYLQRSSELRKALESSAWDGAWYLRAFFDDGTPVGSAANRECRIDSIAQSWAVLSGAADGARSEQAIDSALSMLRDEKNGLLLLFTPPFDATLADPGYIKGYMPGIRENGGQYTHGALWLVWALASMGRGDDAEALFRMLNPIYHADNAEKMERYKVEPYVVAADVYKAAGQVGRGGWTWYTGSAAWMYRLGLEAILGIQRAGAALRVDPCIPKAWPGYAVTYRAGAATLHIRVENPTGVSRGIRHVTMDGQVLPGNEIPVPGAGEHQIVVTLGSRETSQSFDTVTSG